MNANPLLISSSSRSTTLDGVRGIAILLVIAFKSFHVSLVSEPITTKALFFLPSIGWLGVDLFFVLSGFLITGILLDAKTNSGLKAFLRDFYVKRAFRILPLYYAVCALFFVIVPYLTEHQVWPLNESIWYWLHLSNFYQADGHRAGSLSIAWSLAIEEQFYLLWPLVVWLCTPRSLARVCLYLVFGAFLSRTFLAFSDFSSSAIYFLTPCRMDGLALGSMVAALARTDAVSTLIKYSRRILAVAAILLFAFVLVPCFMSLQFLMYRTSAHPAMFILGYTLAALVFSFAIVCTLTTKSPRVHALLGYSLLVEFGKYSYCIYLIHVFVMSAVISTLSFLGAQPKFIGGLLIFVFSLFFCREFGRASWHHFESKLLRYRERYLTRAPIDTSKSCSPAAHPPSPSPPMVRPA